jgi:hypothetical protein
VRVDDGGYDGEGEGEKSEHFTSARRGWQICHINFKKRSIASRFKNIKLVVLR